MYFKRKSNSNKIIFNKGRYKIQFYYFCQKPKTMRKLIFTLFVICASFFSCNDGDIILVELDFDQTLDLCGDENSLNYVVYDTRIDPFESLTLLFPGSDTNDLIFNPPTNPYEESFTINVSSIRFNYRLYDGDMTGKICLDIPPSDITITEDYEALSGTVTSTTTFEDDDNDGVPTLLEDINGNGNLEDDDTDGDGIPNYKDEDDDGDNVPTIKEFPDPNNDELLDDAQDTDDNGIPDYLDNDDDGDGIITRYEDEDLNGNLFDDFAPLAIVARFLDADAIDVFVNDNLNTNTFSRTITVTFIVENVDLEILNTDFIDLGTYTGVLEFEN